MHYTFIEVGTSDFETLLQECEDPSARGLSVEPIQPYLDRLPDKPNVTKVNVALSNTNGSAQFFYIPPDVIEEKGFPSWMRGCNSIHSPHPTVFNTLKFWQYDPMKVIVSQTVPIWTPETLIQTYSVTSVDYLKLDCEGHDGVILNSWLEYASSRPNLLPKKIEFENNELGSAEEHTEKKKALNRLVQLGYTLDPIPGTSNTLATLKYPHVVFCFWTGLNELSPNRKACLEQLHFNLEVPLICVTPSNLPDFIVPGFPLHPAYEFLSLTHRSDYLRMYFMYHYGGGYCDIKRTTGSWRKAFDDLDKDEYKWANGYQEIEGGVPLNIPNWVDSDGRSMVTYPDLTNDYKKLIGNGCYIFRPHTPLGQEWYEQVHKKLDVLLPELRLHPASHPRDSFGENGSLYPIRWSGVLADVFHPLCHKYASRLLQTVPILEFHSYI